MDKNKPMAPPKTAKLKRHSTISVASTSRKLPTKEQKTRPKVNHNITKISEADVTMCKTESTMPDFENMLLINNQFAYGQFLRAIVEDCLVDEKIVREETQMDIQMGQLADRFNKTIEQLDKTNRRLKDISFVAEQRRLIDLKNQDCAKFYETTDASNVADALNNLSVTEQSCLDKLEIKNIDFGYDKESGHKQLLDAVNDAIEGLEQIKKHSNLDIDKFEQYELSQKTIDQLEKDRFDLDSLKSEFEEKFPGFSEKLIKEVSEKIELLMGDNE